MKLLAESQDYSRGGTQKDFYGEDEVEDVPCPFCGDGRPETLYTEHGHVGIGRCRGCGLIFTTPRIREPEKVYWGEEAAYLEEARRIFEGRSTHHRDPNYREELREIERHRRGGRLLDVGCNMGMLLRLARERGWDVAGIEPSPALSRLAARWGFPVFNCFLDEVPEDQMASYDVVALSDVFEHITEPRAFLAAAARLLVPGGLLYVKVPNARWNLLKQHVLALFGRRPSQGLWDAYEHVVHYTDRTLRAMLESAHFCVLRLTGARPVQTPNWHEHVGHYYQYPTPWSMDWKRKTARSAVHMLSFPERALRLGGLGYLSQNVVAVARWDGESAAR